MAVANFGVNSPVSQPGFAAPALPLIRLLDGLDPEKLTTNVMRIYPGCCADSTGSEVRSMPQTDIDMSTVGVNGLDAGAPINGVSYQVYVIKQTSTGNMAFVISSSITYGGVNLPVGYQHFRKLPIGFVYNSAWDGIPAFYLSGWPKADLRLTDAGESATWRALNGGTAAVATDVFLQPWIPDAARRVYLMAVVTATGSAGTAYIKTPIGTAQNLPVGQVNPASGPGAIYTYVDLRAGSTWNIQYFVIGGAALSLYVLGYWMTEPS